MKEIGGGSLPTCGNFPDYLRVLSFFKLKMEKRMENIINDG